MGEDAVPVGPAKTLLEELRGALRLTAGVSCVALEEAARAIGERLVCPRVVWRLIAITHSLTPAAGLGGPCTGAIVTFSALWYTRCDGVAEGVQHGIEQSRPPRSAWWDGEIAKIEAMAAGRRG